MEQTTTDEGGLIQEQFHAGEAVTDPEYIRLLAAYADNPFYDLKHILPPERKEEKSEPASVV